MDDRIVIRRSGVRTQSLGYDSKAVLKQQSQTQPSLRKNVFGCCQPDIDNGMLGTRTVRKTTSEVCDAPQRSWHDIREANLKTQEIDMSRKTFTWRILV